MSFLLLAFTLYNILTFCMVDAIDVGEGVVDADGGCKSPFILLCCVC